MKKIHILLYYFLKKYLSAFYAKNMQIKTEPATFAAPVYNPSIKYTF